MIFVAACLIPILALFTIFSFVPIGMVIWLSVHHSNDGALDTPYIGLHYYDFAFTQDDLFRTSLINTFKYVVVSVPLNIVLSLPIAMGLNQIKRLRAFFRSAFFLPTVASAVAVSLVWLPIYDPQSGWLNAILDKLNLPFLQSQSWLGDPNTALWAVMVAAVWQDLGYNIIVFLAGLQSIPQDFYDAAKVDGAGAWSRTRHITIPLLQRTFAFVLVLTMISYMQEFTHIQVMTQGGPIDSSRTLVLHIYETAFGTNPLMGYGSAVSLVLMGIILVITLVQLRLLRQRWEY
jgi:ABC-type sugar transport system permease subunit